MKHIPQDQFHTYDAAKLVAATGQKVNYRMLPGSRHSYYFVSISIEDHVAHHAAVLNAS